MQKAHCTGPRFARPVLTALYARMNAENLHWKELIESCETVIVVDLYHRLHLRILTKILGYIVRSRPKRASKKGQFLWGALHILEKITEVTSPHASMVFWFYVEGRWVLQDIKRTKVSKFRWQYHFIRKKNVSPTRLKMSLRSYRGVNVARNRI